MLIKRTHDDFYVEELHALTPQPSGEFGFYRLEKRGWTTPDALALVRRRWNLTPQRLSYGGLKDRHAHTVQFFTILRGPTRGIQQQGVTVTHLGRLPHPFGSRDILRNRFQVVIRDCSLSQLEHAKSELNVVREVGVPNYFDEQRFGSRGRDGEFVAKLLILGRYEDALKQALAGDYEYDRSAQKKEKAILLEHWGDWSRCKDLLPRSHARSLVDYLRVHPGDFRGAVLRLRPELRTLYLSAYQSYLWNCMLACWLRTMLPESQVFDLPIRHGTMTMVRSLSQEQINMVANVALPLHSPRVQWETGDARQSVFDQILAEEGLTLDQLKLRGLKELFFSKGERSAFCLPEKLAFSEESDDLYPGKKKLTLNFELPRGSYATLIVKRITERSGPTSTTQDRSNLP